MEPRVSAIYPELFHYTTGEGLLGILSTNTLWATHYKNLNDQKEILLFRDHLACFIRDKFHYEFEDTFANALEKGILGADMLYNSLIRENQKPPLLFQPYITSFCSHLETYEKQNGLLSQWRGYTGNSGYAIVFDTIKLENLLERYFETTQTNGASLSHVIYNNNKEEIEKYITPRCEQLFDMLKELMENSKKPPSKTSETALKAIIRCSTGFKHQSFSEEKEVRLICSPIDIETDKYCRKKFSDKDYPRKNLAQFYYRGKITNPISYIKVFDDQKITLPIKRIIVGPSIDKETRCRNVEKFINANNIAIPEGVVCSETPLV